MLALVVLVVLHALVAIVWIAFSLRLQVQAGLAADGSVPRAVWEGGGRTVSLMTVLAVVYYALAVGAFFTGGGFASYSPVYHTALILGLAFVLVQVLMLQPAWSRLAGGDLTARKRIAMSLGIAHALWLIQFVLMFFGRQWGPYWSA